MHTAKVIKCHISAEFSLIDKHESRVGSYVCMHDCARQTAHYRIHSTVGDSQV